jgi:hypothetical protein
VITAAGPHFEFTIPARTEGANIFRWVALAGGKSAAQTGDGPGPVTSSGVKESTSTGRMTGMGS